MDAVDDAINVPSFEELKAGQTLLMPEVFIPSIVTRSIHFQESVWLSQHSEHLYVVQNPPAKPLTTDGDGPMFMPLSIYTLVRIRIIEKLRGVPATAEIKFSLISNLWMFWRMQFLCTDIFIREGSYRQEVMNRVDNRKQKKLHRIRNLRDISMMLEAQNRPNFRTSCPVKNN